MLNRILPVLFVGILSIGSALSSKAASPVAAGDTIYVDTNATGLNNGTSWADAYTNLQNAITTESTDKIFLVAEGTYFPGLPGSSSATFQLKNGQQLWGGFPTGGTDFTLRNAKTEITILSGDLNANSIAEFGTDAKTVITLNSLSSSLVDGFTISGAINDGGNGGGIYINNSSATISHNIIEKNQADQGAGIFCNNLFATPPSISKNLIRQNIALNTGKGGGMYISGQIFVRNNVITENSSFFGGGAFITETSEDARFINNTIVANLSPPAPSNPVADTCPSIGGVLFQNLGGRAIFYNNLIWSNPFSETNGNPIDKNTVYTDPTASGVFYNITPNSSLNGVNGNKNTDPTLNTDLSIKKCSPAIESGLNALLYQGGYNDSTDYLGNKRLLDGNFDGTITIDLGAIESQLICEPCTTDAGTDASVCALTHIMNARKPGFERSGKWTQITGPGTTTYDYDTLETATITVTQQGVYRYRWTLTGSDCTVSDDVIITFFKQPVANGGPDTSAVCGRNAMTAAVLSTGNGIWSSIESGVGFGNNTDAITTVNLTTYGNYHLIWTERNGICPASADTVVLQAFQQNVANAGVDFSACQFDTALNAIPTMGTGTWNIFSGPGGAAFGSPNFAQSHVTVTLTGSYVFRWTEVNGVCPPSSDFVTVNFKPQSVANAGGDIDTCGNIAFLDAQPSYGLGAWTMISGPASSTVAFNQNNYAKTKATFSDIGQYILRWTETNSPCPASFDDVVVNLVASSIVSLETITDRYCGPNDEILVGVRINGVPPFTFIMEAQHFRDTIVTNSSYYIFSDSNAFKQQSELDFKIISFIDGRDCGAIMANNLVQVPRIGENLAPVGTGFSAATTVLCNSNSTVLTLNYANLDDLIFTILDSAKGTSFTAFYQGGLVSIPVTNLKYGDNIFKITSAVKSVGGCEMILAGNLTLNIVYKPVSFTVSVQHLTCFESNDGSIILNVQNKADVTEIALNGVPNTSLFNTYSLFNLAAASYGVRVTNNAGCTQNRNAIITQPAKINYTYAIVNPTCNGSNNGNVNITTSGGAGALTIHFGNLNEPAPHKFLNLANGTYPVKITDNSTGCIVFADSVKIVEPAVLAIQSVSADANCDGSAFGNIAFTVTGGNTPYNALVTKGSYQLTIPSFTAPQLVSNLQPGIYNIKITDAKGCVANIKDTVSQSPELAYTAVKVKDADCQSLGVIEITVPSTEPGTLYSIDGVNFGTATVFSNLNPGPYTVTAKAPSGCINRKQFEILDRNVTFSAIPTVLEQPSCYNGADGVLYLQIFGGSGHYAIIIDGGQAMTDTIIDSLAAGSHNIVIVDLNCALVLSFTATLTNPSDFQSSVILSKKPTCSYSNDGLIRVKSGSPNNGLTQFSINGGSSYQYGDIFTNLGSSTYQIRVKDSKGCESQVLEYALKAPDSLMINATFVNDFTTRTADITINGSGGTPPYNYSLDGNVYVGNNLFENREFAYTTAYIIDSAGCRNQVTLKLGDVGIDNITVDHNINIHPNPSNGTISISGLDVNQIQEIVVYTILGEKLVSLKPSAATDLENIDLHSLKSGYYLMSISTKQSITIHKIEILK